jgi:hypothetical protein
MTKFSPHFGRTIKGRIPLLLPHLTLLTTLIAKVRPEQGWRELYEASLLELDRTKLPERVRAAREAIHRRLAQAKETLSWEEHAEIDDALRALVRRGV